MSLTLDYALERVELNTSFNKTGMPLLQLAWDSTSLGAFKVCPFKYFLTVVLGYGVRRKDPLVFGIAFHDAMQFFHYELAVSGDLDSAHKAALRKAIKSFSFDGVPHQAESKERSLYGLLRAVSWYIEHYKQAQKADPCKTLILDNGKPAAELSFRFTPDMNLPSDFTEFYLCGHMDLVVEFQDSIFVQDYKTTKNLSSYFFNQFNPENQMSLYTLAGNIVFNRPVRGVIIDGVQVAVGFNRFQRGFTYRTPEQLENWLEDTEFWLHVAHRSAATGHYPQNDKSCNQYGGCEYRDVCSAPASLHKNILDSKFDQRIWDPLIAREL